MIIAGVDEAGRGPVLGPMVLGVAVIEKKNEESLRKLGAKDSKLVPYDQRGKLCEELKKQLIEFRALRVSTEELNKLMKRKSLNEIEAMRIGEMLNELENKPEMVFVDCPDPTERSFVRRLRKYISFDTIIKAEHKADYKYPIVSAASIIAKVERDETIEELKKEFGEIGSGYSHDETTIKFLKKWIDKNKSLPRIARTEWETSRRMLADCFQKKLGE